MKMPQTALSKGMPLEELVTVFGPLAETVPMLQLGTIQHADELINARRTNKDLRNIWFYTADSAVYTMEDGQAILYFGRGQTNPIFKNLEEATRQLTETRNYIINREELEAVKGADSTLRVQLSDLRFLQFDYWDEWVRFEIKTKNPDSLNKAERAFAERVYGRGEEFRLNMEMLNKARKEVTRIQVLNPKYVEENVPQYGGLARASDFYGIKSYSMFYVTNCSVLIPLALRGVMSR